MAEPEEVDALIRAIEAGDRAAVVAALDAGIAVNGPRGKWPQRVPLFVAARGAPELVPPLLARGADATAVLEDETALTSLFLPLIGGRDEDELCEPERAAAVLALARAGADVDHLNARNRVRLLVSVAGRAPSPLLVAALLDAGATIDAPGQFGRAALHEVAGNDEHTATLELLLARGAKVDVVSERGATPLLAAVGGILEHRVSLAHTRLLLGHGADPSHVDRDGVSVLAAARVYATPEIVAVLLGAGAKPAPSDGLLGAALSGDEASARARLAGAELEAKTKDGATALLVAAERAPGLVPELLARGADPTALDGKGEGALLKVAGAGRGLPHDDVFAAAKALLDAGLDPNVTSKRGATPLGRALSRQPEARAALIELFLARGAKASARDDSIHDGYTMLGIAATRGRPRFVELLLGAKAKLEQKSKRESLTPLLTIWRTSGVANDEAGRTACLRLLLAAGAKPDAKDGKDGGTVLHQVAGKRDLEPARLLLDAGASPNATNDRGETPLHRAVFWSWSEPMVRLLLERGADAGARDAKGKTPLDVMGFASKETKIGELLRAAGGGTGERPSVFSAFGVAEGDGVALVRAVEKEHAVTLHPDVARFVAEDVDPSGVLRLGRFSERFMERASFDGLFGRLGAGRFPGVKIGSRFGIDVWLMLESARIVALHHDATFSEVAATVKVRTPAKFVEAFVPKASALTLAQLLEVEATARGLDLTKKADATKLLGSIAEILGQSKAAASRSLSTDVRLEILRELCRAALSD